VHVRRVVLASMMVTMTALAAPPAPTLKLMELGKTAYEASCVACHGVTGEGNGPVAFAVKPPPRNFKKDKFKAGDSVEQIFHTITNGLPETLMVGYPHFEERQRWALAYYVRAFRPTR
jgi:high-affinity iron transporter